MTFLTSSLRGPKMSLKTYGIIGIVFLTTIWAIAMLQTTQKFPEVTVKYSSDVDSPYNSSKLALLIEGRPIETTVPLMLHMISVVPHDWKHMFMGTKESVAALNTSAAIRNFVKTGKLNLTFIPENMTINNGETTSQFLTTPYLYETLLHPAEHLLLWQTDSVLCANANHTIDDYLEYDWVGAPWGGPGARFGGNGGLSLRKVSAILQLLHAQRRMPNEDPPEDVWFSNSLYRRPGSKMANGSVEITFSMETSAVYDLYPLGYHIGASGRLPSGAILGTKERRKRVWDYCPELKLAVINIDAEKYVQGDCGGNWKRAESEDEMDYWLPEGMYAWGVPNPELI